MLTSWNHVLQPPKGLASRSINAENPDGRPGNAARTASVLGPSRKGRAALPLPAHGQITLADIQGPGVIRHIWITVPDKTDGGPFVLRDLVLRMYWDGEPEPSVEVPLGDFFCNGFGSRALVASTPVIVAPSGGMNCYFPMPFRRSARIVIDSDHPADVGAVFFQIDYTVGDELDERCSYFHAQWRRSNGTLPLGQDHVVVDGIEGHGAYVGTYIALTALERYWWGEGEMKFYIDDDDSYPTQCSTGLEDYAGGAWAFQDQLSNDPAPNPIPFSAPFFGYPHVSSADDTKASPFSVPMPVQHAMYRWHLPDPIYFAQAMRVTLQQIGAWDHGLFERSDDISTVAYWYQSGTHAAFPALPNARGRRPR